MLARILLQAVDRGLGPRHATTIASAFYPSNLGRGQIAHIPEGEAYAHLESAALVSCCHCECAGPAQRRL